MTYFLIRSLTRVKDDYMTLANASFLQPVLCMSRELVDSLLPVDFKNISREVSASPTTHLHCTSSTRNHHAIADTITNLNLTSSSMPNKRQSSPSKISTLKKARTVGPQWTEHDQLILDATSEWEERLGTRFVLPFPRHGFANH